MKPETFFEKFDLFADAPDAVAKMRGLILRLAMQGRLSEPHKTDGTVGQLLIEIQKDKVQLGLEPHNESASAISDLSDNDTSDVIPARWTWVRFGDVARHNAGKTLDKGRNRGQLRDYITTSNLYWGLFQLDTIRKMPILDDELERCTAIKGDLLICEGGEAGRAAVWPHNYEICFQNHVHCARFLGGINPYFVQRYFEKLNATNEISNYRKGVGISNMSGKALASIPIPLPPLAEQKRIVAKVDELMALCDRLEAQQQERETQHAALARASLARFADAPTPANLDHLFHNSYSISPADLRKSILTLAVQGKLVPQDPNDAPVEYGKVCRAANIVEVTSERLPKNWGSATLADVAERIVDCPHSTPKWTERGKLCIRTNQFSPGFLDLTDSKFVSDETFNERIQRLRPKQDDILYSREGGILGVACRIPQDVELCLGQRMMLIRSGDCVSPTFLEMVLNAPLITEIARQQTTGGAAPRVNVSTVKAYPIPIPPLAEQRRIVAKVDDLMALVDALETQLDTSQSTGETIMKAAVSELTAAACPIPIPRPPPFHPVANIEELS